MAIHNVKAPGDTPITNAAGAAESAKSQKTSKATAAANAYAKAGPAPTVSDAANVQISPRAKEMSLARKVAEETPDVDEAKIKKYTDAIEQRKYKADAGKIADGMAKEALMDEFASNRG
ncbi:MAG: flagellar biosynthesis anti-sigma factor FlgM [Bdellovibrionota bacterium]